MPADPAEGVLHLHGVTKRFGSVQALRGVDFLLRAGEVHALLGENGAGKSTLMHIAAGLIRPDAGTMDVHGRRTELRSPRDARRAGIGMVHQHFTTVPALTVAENLALARGVAPAEWNRGAVLSHPLVQRLRDGLGPRRLVESLSVGEKQRLEILKAVVAGQRILLLDEPTAVLAPAETNELIAWSKAFATEGGSVVFITHKLDEARAAADRVTVLRDGSVRLAGPISNHPDADLALAMIGKRERYSDSGLISKSSSHKELRVSFRNLIFSGHFQTLPRTDDTETSLHVREGEIVGIAAVEGSGQRELMHTIAGLVAPGGGELEVAGPVALVPEDRTTEALILDHSLVENLVLASGADAPWVRSWGRISWDEAREATRNLLREFDVRAPGPDTPARALSGGNQQKFVMGRALSRDPRVLIAENPTRGLDLHATAAIHARLRVAAAGGAAVIFHSADLDEVLELADRVWVVARGRVTEARSRDRETIGRMMLGVSGARGGVS